LRRQWQIRRRMEEVAVGKKNNGIGSGWKIRQRKRGYIGLTNQIKPNPFIQEF